MTNRRIGLPFSGKRPILMGFVGRRSSKEARFFVYLSHQMLQASSFKCPGTLHVFKYKTKEQAQHERQNSRTKFSPCILKHVIFLLLEHVGGNFHGCFGITVTIHQEDATTCSSDWLNGVMYPPQVCIDIRVYSGVSSMNCTYTLSECISYHINLVVM